MSQRYWQRGPWQLHPHRHLIQLRLRPQQLPLRRITAPSLQILLDSLQEHSAPLFQLRRRDLKLAAHFTQIFTERETPHYQLSSKSQ